MMAHAGLVNRLLCRFQLGEYSPRTLRRRSLEADVRAARSRFFEVGSMVQQQSRQLALLNMKTTGYANSVAHAVEGVAETFDRKRRGAGPNEPP